MIRKELHKPNAQRESPLAVRRSWSVLWAALSASVVSGSATGAVALSARAFKAAFITWNAGSVPAGGRHCRAYTSSRYLVGAALARSGLQQRRPTHTREEK